MHKYTRNKVTCKYQFTKRLSCVWHSFQYTGLGKNGFQHNIVTLDPNKFAEKKQQCLHIGNIQCFAPHISLLKQPSPVTGEEVRYFNTARYPSGTKAFLYYSMSPENPASQENYASESHQAMMLLPSKVGRTLCDRMVGYGHVHFFIFQNIILLCMKL